MSIYACGSCDARNTSPGHCIMCGSSLGSLKKAITVGAVITGQLGALWIVVAVVFRVQVVFVAVLFGGVISGLISSRSGGRGLTYQAIATTYTIAGMVLSDTLVVWHLWTDLTGTPVTERPQLWPLIQYQVLYDPATIAFCLLGIAGGFFIWRDPAE